MTRFRRRPLRCRSLAGFAYVWMLLAIALLATGAALAVEVDSTLAQRERERELLRLGHAFRSAIERYHEQQIQGGRKQYPASLDDLLQDSRLPGVRRYLRRIPVDPMTGTTEWGLVRVGGRIVAVHSLSPRRAIKQDGFEPEDDVFKGRQRVDEWVFAYPSGAALSADPNAPAASAVDGARP